MFDELVALQSDLPDSNAMGKFFSQKCVTVFAGWSFRNVWNIADLSKCLFNPLVTSGAYITGVKKYTFQWLILNDIALKETFSMVWSFDYDYMHHLWNYSYYISTKIDYITPL